MKKYVLILSLVFAFVFMFSIAAAAEDPTISISSAEAKPGEEVTVEVSIANNTGFAGFEIQISFDTDVLTLKSVDMTGAIITSIVTPTDTANTNGEVIFTFGTATNITTEAGIIANLTFTINENTTIDSSKLTISIEDLYDSSLDDLEATATDGTITIESTPATGGGDKATTGDVNGDNELNLADGLFALQALLNNDSSFDINNDGEFNLLDILHLLKMIAAA